jgi:uncharacterized protein YndB with AHSA1/START domain/tRNA(Arg) A34 adenosine deaminase TadA
MHSGELGVEAAMSQVLALAQDALDAGELPIAAAVVLDGAVVASASTAERAERRRLVHAELRALDAADRLHPPAAERARMRLFTNVEPCLMCLGAAMSFGIGELYYGVPSPTDGSVALIQSWTPPAGDLAPVWYRVPRIVGGIRVPETRALFHAYVDRHGTGPMVDWARTLIDLPCYPPRVISTRVTRHIRAPRAAVYRAFLEADAVQRWMVPTGMTSQVHVFDPREGGAFRVSLTYDAPTGTGKSSAHTDTYHGRFVQLVPNERIVQAVEFETADPAIQGEMTITVTLADADGGTELVAVHDHLPPGVSPDDNELGWRISLDKLAALVEAN